MINTYMYMQKHFIYICSKNRKVNAVWRFPIHEISYFLYRYVVYLLHVLHIKYFLYFHMLHILYIENHSTIYALHIHIMDWCDTYAKQGKQPLYEGRLIWKIVKSLIIAHTSPNDNFLYTQHMYFPLMNPNMSFDVCC